MTYTAYQNPAQPAETLTYVPNSLLRPVIKTHQLEVSVDDHGNGRVEVCKRLRQLERPLQSLSTTPKQRTLLPGCYKHVGQ
eukprot:1055382-Pelagomonas_calceolata.AAC.7